MPEREWSHLFYKRYSLPLINLFIKLHITANKLTVFNFLLMFFGAGWFLSRGEYWTNWIALGIISLCVILDYADGDIARKTNSISKAGIWLDSNSDIILQNAIMGAIAIGNLPYDAWMIISFFIANITLNMTSLQFNNTFGFDSYKGNELFRQYMDKKPTSINKIFKNIIDPTSSKTGLFLFTIRYWIIIGIIFDCLWLSFWIITFITILRAIFMYIIYTLHLLEYKKLWLLQALAIIDEERQEFYNIRQLKKTEGYIKCYME